METPHYLSDLDEMIAGLDERQQLNIDAVRAMDRELTDAENARFEVGWGLLRDLTTDLRQMRDAWAEGHPMYRKTEKMLENAG
jgi:hypothetical protein